MKKEQRASPPESRWLFALDAGANWGTITRKNPRAASKIVAAWACRRRVGGT
jgi:hypothetical protein